MGNNANVNTNACKPGCKEKVYRENRDPMFRFALRESSIATIFINLKEIDFNQEEIGDDADNRYLFNQLLNKDILSRICILFVNVAIIDRIEKSTSLRKNPWKISNHNRLIAPDSCPYKMEKSYVHKVSAYRIPGYFWVDDIYLTDICKCDAYKAKMKSLRRVQNEAKTKDFVKMYMGAY
jgi:hypothetical protein